MEKTKFKYVFIANNIKYRYFFSYDESLDAYYTQKSTNIFKKTKTNNYEFTNDKSKLESIENKIIKDGGDLLKSNPHSSIYKILDVIVKFNNL